MKTRATKVGKMVRGPTPVKVKIKRIEQGILGPSTGKPIGKGGRKGEKGKDSGPGAEKQKRILEFFEKRTKVHQRTDPGPGETSSIMGATLSSPLLGVPGCPALKTPSNKGRGSKPEVRGGVGGMKGKKRTPVVLEKWFGPPKPKTGSLASGVKGVGSEDCPERDIEERTRKAEDSDTQE